MFRVALFFLATLLFGLTAVQAAAPSGDKTVEVEGYGSSKADALLQAKRSAVEEGIGVVLTSQTEVANFALVKDRVLTQSVGSVRSYQLLKENQQGDGWLVRIRAVVSLDSITADLMALKLLLVSMDKPRTMVLIEEQEGKNAESTIVDYLQGKGFELVDPAQAATLMAKDDPFISRAIAGDPVAAARLGAENGAEYIIVGTVRKSMLKGNQMLSDAGMHSGQASLTVKVVNCSSGRIVASKSATGAAVHTAEDIAASLAAAKAAATLMDQQLFEAIVASFQDTINNGANYEVVVVGVNSFAVQKQLVQLLEGEEGVVTVTKRAYGGGKLELSVLFKGSVDTFCERVDSRTLGEATLLVGEVVGSRVVINLQ
jgi:hypothetical protein